MNKGFPRKITELDKLNYELDSIDEKFESYVDAVSGYADTVEELEDELLVYNEKLDWSRRKGLIDPSLEDHIYSIADLLEEAGERGQRASSIYSDLGEAEYVVAGAPTKFVSFLAESDLAYQKLTEQVDREPVNSFPSEDGINRLNMFFRAVNAKETWVENQVLQPEDNKYLNGFFGTCIVKERFDEDLWKLLDDEKQKSKEEQVFRSPNDLDRPDTVDKQLYDSFEEARQASGARAVTPYQNEDYIPPSQESFVENGRDIRKAKRRIVNKEDVRGID